MRLAVKMLICLAGSGAALAEPPAGPAVATPAAQAASSAPVASNNTPATAAPSDSAPSPKKQELSADEKSLLSRGYKLEMRGGQKYFCHEESQLGTRFSSKVCRSAEQMASLRKNSQEFTSEMQRPSGNRAQ